MSFPPHPGAPLGRGARLRPLHPPKPGVTALPVCAIWAAARSVVATAARTARAALATDGEPLATDGNPRATPGSVPDPRRTKAAAAELAEFVYELLDAHADTAELASGLDLDHDWRAHLEYLRALQRHGRHLLAEASRAPALAA